MRDFNFQEKKTTEHIHTAVGVSSWRTHHATCPSSPVSESSGIMPYGNFQVALGMVLLVFLTIEFWLYKLLLVFTFFPVLWLWWLKIPSGSSEQQLQIWLCSYLQTSSRFSLLLLRTTIIESMELFLNHSFICLLCSGITWWFTGPQCWPDMPRKKKKIESKKKLSFLLLMKVVT